KYLNYLSIQLYQIVYRTKKEDTNRVAYFFKTEVPILLYQYRKFIYFSFAVFAVLVSIGVISAANDDSFVRLILGDGYVNDTLDNIEDGNPVAVYKSGSDWGSF